MQWMLFKSISTLTVVPWNDNVIITLNTDLIDYDCLHSLSDFHNPANLFLYHRKVNGKQCGPGTSGKKKCEAHFENDTKKRKLVKTIAFVYKGEAEPFWKWGVIFFREVRAEQEPLKCFLLPLKLKNLTSTQNNIFKPWCMSLGEPSINFPCQVMWRCHSPGTLSGTKWNNADIMVHCNN